MRKNGLFLLALIAGTSFIGEVWLGPTGLAMLLWKGSGVALLALWAAIQARNPDGWLLALVLALGALGDVLLEAMGLTAGAIAFLIGHYVAVALYLRNGVRPWYWTIAGALPVAALAFAIAHDGGIAFYALGLGAMTGAALASRFPLAGVGALLFLVSDLLIFSRLGPLAHSPLPNLLIWPCYFAGQALIAWGVARRV